MTKSRKLAITSLITLASVLAEMLENDDHETIPAPVHETVSTPIQDLGPEIKILTIDLEVPSEEMSPPQDLKHLEKPSTLHQPTIDQLTQELAQSTKQKKGYVKLIAELQDENKELRL